MYCEVGVKGGSENVHGKVNILLQTHLSRGQVNSFSLVSDQAYVTQVCSCFFKVWNFYMCWGLQAKSNICNSNVHISLLMSSVKW